jgi:hypothetical protein
MTPVGSQGSISILSILEECRYFLVVTNFPRKEFLTNSSTFTEVCGNRASTLSRQPAAPLAVDVEKARGIRNVSPGACQAILEDTAPVTPPG